jgi:hypothetical protein
MALKAMNKSVAKLGMKAERLLTAVCSQSSARGEVRGSHAPHQD